MELKGFRMVFCDTATVYDMVGDWHEGHGWPRLPIDMLPPIAAVAFIEDRAVAAVWAYDAGQGIAWMDYMVTNPQAGMKAAVALKQLCQEFSDYLTEKGVKYIHSCCRQPSLGRVLEKAGFTKTDTEVIHFIKVNAN